MNGGYGSAFHLEKIENFEKMAVGYSSAINLETFEFLENIWREVPFILKNWKTKLAGSMIYLANVLLAQDTTSAARMSPSVAWPELLIF